MALYGFSRSYPMQTELTLCINAKLRSESNSVGENFDQWCLMKSLVILYSSINITKAHSI